MHSRIYTGSVRHRRVAPRHRFHYRVFMLYLDLSELPELFDGVPLWSARRAAPARFKRSDYLGPVDVPLDEAVRDLVESRLGRRPRGPIRLLTHLRYFGYCMNPVSFYYCFSETGERLETIVAEVTNTPWGERHQYVLAARKDRVVQRFEFDKAFHVSPFMPMDVRYRWSFGAPGERLQVHMQATRGDGLQFDATLSLRGAPVTRGALLRALAAFPVVTLKIIAAIHWQAARLWWKRTPVYGHPRAAG